MTVNSIQILTRQKFYSKNYGKILTSMMVMMANNSYLKIKRRIISFEITKEPTRSTLSDMLTQVLKNYKR